MEKRAFFASLQRKPTALEWLSEKSEPGFERCTTAGTLPLEEADYGGPDIDPETNVELLREICVRRDKQCCEALCASTGMRCHNKATKQVAVNVRDVSIIQRMPIGRLVQGQPAPIVGSGLMVGVCEVHYRAMLRAQRSGVAWNITRVILEAGVPLLVSYGLWLGAGARVANFADQQRAPAVFDERALAGLSAPSAPGFLTGRAPDPGLLARREAAHLEAQEEYRRLQLKRRFEREAVAAEEDRPQPPKRHRH
jgi:hypothetical protein